MEDFDSVVIPIFFILMIVAVSIGPIWIRSYYQARERAQLHETLRKAYDQGLPPPPELIEKLANREQVFSVSPTSDRDLRRAVVLIAVGIGLGFLGLGLGYGISLADQMGGWITGGAIAGAGAIPGMIGLAYLVLWLARRSRPGP